LSWLGEEDIEALASIAAASATTWSPPTSIAASRRRRASSSVYRDWDGPRGKRRWRQNEMDATKSTARNMTGGRWRRLIVSAEVWLRAAAINYYWAVDCSLISVLEKLGDSSVTCSVILYSSFETVEENKDEKAKIESLLMHLQAVAAHNRPGE
jgi:hypothetical protein